MRRRAFHFAALATLLCFGCATARGPLQASAQPIPLTGPAPSRVALAEPTLELWMEGTRAVDPAESAAALDASRDALAQALGGRGLDDAEGADLLLRVDARAVARTGERRTAQVWSAVGIVAAVVVVVAAIILCRDRPRSGPQRTRAVGGPRPGPWRARPVARAAPPSFFWSVGVHVAVPLGPAAGAGPGDGEPTVSDPLLDGREWFDGDEVELTATLVDPASGAARWRRTLRERGDPRDAAAMRRMVDRALAGAPLGTPPRAPPGAVPEPEARPAPEPAPGPAREAAGADL